VNEPIWLSKELMLALHDRLLAEFGGLAGVRDEGFLDSALNKPKNLFACDKPALHDLAATYAFAIIRNHPFLDGNKRVGFIAAAIFLATNGFELTATEADATIATLALAAGGMDKKAYSAWLRNNSAAQTSG
jgi:death-on-curing protein